MKEVRCSKLDRIMKCAGPWIFDIVEEEAGLPAQQGTACGELLQMKLEGHEKFPSVASNGIEFDTDMIYYTDMIAKEIRENAAGPILCEQRIDWTTESGVIVRGQYDASYIDCKGRLNIDDLKYGWGIVNVKENWQLLGYAIGEVIRRQQMFDEIVLRIRQPRPHHEDGPVREWVISYNELLSYKSLIETRLKRLTLGDRELKTGSQCKYCPAAAEACSAFNRSFYSTLETVMDGTTQDNITDRELAKQLAMIDRAEEILKIKKDSLTSLGVTRIRQGKVIQGYSIEQKTGDRIWRQGVDPAIIKEWTGVDVMRTEMVSPAQAEKLGVPKGLVKGLITRPFVGVKLVRVDSTKQADKVFGNKPANAEGEKK